MDLTSIFRRIFLPLLLLPLAAACNTVDDDRVPDLPVVINLSSPEYWHTYGVSAFGQYNIFIKSLGEPRNFPFVANTSTGYGGVLLVCGFNPFTLEAAVPMAYDLCCPVERKPDIRVRMQQDEEPLPFAVCPECGSRYNVVEGGGGPMKDCPAYSKKYGLRRYECLPSGYGGYLITN